MFSSFEAIWDPIVLTRCVAGSTLASSLAAFYRVVLVMKRLIAYASTPGGSAGWLTIPTYDPPITTTFLSPTAIFEGDLASRKNPNKYDAKMPRVRNSSDVLNSQAACLIMVAGRRYGQWQHMQLMRLIR